MALTAADRRTVAECLRTWGYPSVEAWAEDNDYYQCEGSGEWCRHGAGPFEPTIDLEVECFRAIELEAEAQHEQRYTFF